jgi:hypothetical protein
MIPNQALSEAARRLHRYLLKKHWNGQAVVGPDPGIRFNARIGRFIKSYFDFLPWSDNLIYAQAQKYWILSNWLMADLELSEKEECQDIAVTCAEYLLAVQRPEGYWEYPNPEWKDRIATVEGNYATMGLLETYCRTNHEPFLAGAKKWYEFAVEQIGFQGTNGLLAINYFGNRGKLMVPNNSASALRTFAMLASATNDNHYLEYCPGMVTWLNKVQLGTGELPYAVAGSNANGKKDRIHFLCYQYNAFQFLNLVDYFRMTGDSTIWPVLKNLACFVAAGVSETGASWYDCHHEKPEVPYYTIAAGAALRQATQLEIGNYSSIADRAYQRVLSQQRSDGCIAFYSQGNYGVLTDRRSYPRYLSMILYHLLLEIQQRTN